MVTVSYNGQTKDVTIAAGSSVGTKGATETFVATPSTTEITGTAVPSDGTLINAGSIIVTVPQINVNVTAPGSEIVEGTFVLVDVVGSIVIPLDAGVKFTTAAGDELETIDGGQVTISTSVPSGLYQNLTKGYNFTVKTATPTTGITLTGADSVIAGDVYTLTLAAAGSYVDQTATIDFGDGTGASSITLAATQAPTHTYTVADDYTINVTVDGKSFYKDVDVITGPTSVDVNAHGTAFVYQTVRVLDDTTPVTKLYFYSSDSTPILIATMDATDAATGTFNLLEASVNGHYGAWYAAPYSAGALSTDYITIWYPDIALKAELTTGALGATSGDSIDGKTISKNTEVSFLIETPNVGPAKIATVKIVFTTPAGGKTTQFGTEPFTGIDLTTVQTIAGYTDAGDDAAAGTWIAQAEFTSPKGFSDNAKKTNTVSFTLQSTSLVLTAANDSVVRSNPFTVSIQGDSKMVYFIYLDGASASDVNPTLQPSQSGMLDVNVMNVATNNGQPVVTDAYTTIEDTWAYFETDASGKRTVQYNTAANTEDKTYTVKVYATDLDKATALAAGSADVKGNDYDSVKVKVEKGAVTITASGDGSYYIGDEIKLTGTNTDSDNIFLFLTGQNLIENGIVLKDLPTKTAAKFGMNQKVAVKADDTWEFKWDTSKIALDTGAYTIYATSKITNGKSSTAENVTIDGGLSYYTAFKLSDSEYATVSINLKQPFLSAVPSGTIVAKGDKIYIRGTAEGDPSNLRLYIFGPNFFDPYTITVEDDGSYEKKIDSPSTMSSNQYFVVVQHPMYNNEFDAKLIAVDANGDEVAGVSGPNDLYQWAFKTVSTTTGGDAQSFIVWGSANKLQGSQAADVLTKMIDSANIDDIYTKLTFTVAEPWIKITYPGDKATGSKFTISGTTNLAVDDRILVEVMSSSFSAVDKTSTTSGVSQTTKVVAGEGTDNTWSVEVDTTNWKLDEYTIKVQGIEVDVTTTTNFNLVDNLVEKVVTTTPTTAATTTVPTGATATATTAPTQTPGFGAFIALAGLGAVALFVLRRN